MPDAGPHTPLDRYDLEPEADLELGSWRDLDLSGADLRGARVLECELVGCRLDDALARGARLPEGRLHEVTATALDLTEATLCNVALTGCRGRRRLRRSSGWHTWPAPPCPRCRSSSWRPRSPATAE